ncbi:putative glutamate receptor ionotropic, kainate 2-like 19 [Homarus americanus]|uniref:Putative glutamate receptor ionotropic, kainate 2-like 19 n=1 Tax=Homarus americanus TaxID=6706 RepID=A0A8J5TKS6_HOMAM|nr:putative glutamate receptor ionotropic, kainate 2-like 19 [Homarus americanus]
MLVGWWCVFSILVGTMYRSSLVAHLSLPTKGSPVETFEQLLVQDGWSWGLEPTYGAEWEWFKSSTTPAIKDIFQGIEILDTEAHLERVVRGGHALLTWKYHIHNIVASRYTDTRGYTPVHIGRVEYFVSTGYGWGFRKGAPFLRRLDKTKQRLIETGLINYWLNDLIQTSAREARRDRMKEEEVRQQEEKENANPEDERENIVVIGLRSTRMSFSKSVQLYRSNKSLMAAKRILEETLVDDTYEQYGVRPCDTKTTSTSV